MLSVGALLTGGNDPWFRRRPRLALALASLMFVAVFALRMGSADAADGIALLFTFPIALLAVTFGARVGCLSGVLGAVLLVTWALIADVPLTPTGWAARVSPMLLMGLLLGDAVDRLHRAEGERQRLRASARRQRDAIELNDAIVQQLTAAKWALESGNADHGLEIVTETLQSGHQLVSQLIRDADLSAAWTGVRTLS